MQRLILPLACLALSACSTPTARVSHGDVTTHKLPDINPAVIKSIEQLQMPAPSKALSYLDLTGTSTYLKTSKPERIESFIAPDPATGQLAINYTENGHSGRQISWRGLLTLSSSESNKSGQTTTLVGSLNFEGDWKQLNVGSQVSYTRRQTLSNNYLGTLMDSTWKTVCTIDSEVSASQLNPSLSGNAKALSCRQPRENLPLVPMQHYYYLVDYGFFYHARTDQSDDIGKQMTIMQVR